MQKTKTKFKRTQQFITILKEKSIAKKEKNRKKKAKAKEERKTSIQLSTMFFSAFRLYGIFIPFLMFFASLFKSLVIGKIYHPERLKNKKQNVLNAFQACYVFFGSILMVTEGYYALTVITIFIFSGMTKFLFDNEGNEKKWGIIMLIYCAVAMGILIGSKHGFGMDVFTIGKIQQLFTLI